MSDHVLDQLSAYLDDELVPLERATIDVHLASCPACARQLEELAAIDRAARALPAEAPAQYFDDFATRVRARIQTKASRRPWRLPVFTLAAAAGLALAVLTPMLMREKPSPAPAAAVPEPARVADAEQAAAPLQEQTRSAPPATVVPAAPKPQDRLQAKVDTRAPSSVESLGYASGGAAGAPAPRDESERRKDKSDEPGRSEPEVAAKRARAQGFAAAPEQKEELAVSVETPAAPAAAAAAPQPTTQPALKARERDADAGAAVGKLEVQRSAANAASAQPPGGEGRFRGLLAKRAGSAAEARALREEWRAFSEKALGPDADEARVRVIEAGVVAYGLGNDARDLARLKADATAYLERPDAAQAARVQALLRSVGAQAP